MASAINTRWLRKTRVVYTDGDNFSILLASPEPGKWYVVNSNGSIVTRGSKWISSYYSRLLTSIGNIPADPSSTDSLRRIHATLSDPSKMMPLYSVEAAALARRVDWLLVKRSSGIPFALPPTPAATSGAIKDAIDKTKAAKTDASRASGKFEIAPYDPESFWYESEEDASLYKAFFEMRRNHHPVNMLIAGPSGSGKTEGIIRLGKELGIPVHIINCQAITTPEKWIGQMHADVETGTRFIPSQHIEWVERTHSDCEGFDTCILLYDEITRLRPELNNMTYSLFDTQRGLEVPQMGRRVTMDHKNMIVATANIGSAFTGTHTQDRAFRERFAITMERSFPPVDAEIKILVSSTKVDKSEATTLVQVADQTRKMWGNDDIESPISTRTLKAWSLLVAGGYSIKKAAEYTVIPLYSNDGGLASDRTKVASLIEGKVR